MYGVLSGEMWEGSRNSALRLLKEKKWVHGCTFAIDGIHAAYLLKPLNYLHIMFSLL